MRNVAVFIESSTQYGRNMLQGVAQYAQLAGWRLYYEQGGLNREEPEWLRDWQGDGVITRAARMRFSPKLAAKGMAVIRWDGDPMGPRPKDVPHSDEEAIGKLAATYFMRKGFRHFAFVGFHDAVYSDMRQEAFHLEVEQAGHPPVQDFITSRAEVHHADQEDAARQFLRSLPNPCAVFCATDERAAQILGIAADCGRTVPEQLSVLGVDNDPILCQISHPSLASINTNASAAGLAVAERLDAMMHQREPAPVTLIQPAGVV
ncbi:MAG: substrate-binding domain-containing protein [Verrucomicrobiaceae bacterium]|nr:substrate-binding domain-containing protein [Verrucomicrobiaceae bacterium]